MITRKEILDEIFILLDQNQKALDRLKKSTHETTTTRSNVLGEMMTRTQRLNELGDKLREME